MPAAHAAATAGPSQGAAAVEVRSGSLDLVGIRAKERDTREPPVADAQEGRLRGVSTDKLDIFKGVHYVGTTAGKGRFRFPTVVKAWEGVRESVAFGDICFQNIPNWEGWKENSNGGEDA